MSYQVEAITNDKIKKLFSIQEDHFNDFKAKDVSGKNSVRLFLHLQTQVEETFILEFGKSQTQKLNIGKVLQA